MSQGERWKGILNAEKRTIWFSFISQGKMKRNYRCTKKEHLIPTYKSKKERFLSIFPWFMNEILIHWNSHSHSITDGQRSTIWSSLTSQGKMEGNHRCTKKIQLGYTTSSIKMQWYGKFGVIYDTLLSMSILRGYKPLGKRDIHSISRCPHGL